MAPHYLLLANSEVLLLLEVIIILNQDAIVMITLERKQSKKAELLISYLYKDTSFLYDIAHYFQDEQRYTLSLLHDVLNFIDYKTLATLGFRESYLKSLNILFKGNMSNSEYIKRLIAEDDQTAIDIASVIQNLNIKERRDNDDRY